MTQARPQPDGEAAPTVWSRPFVAMLVLNLTVNLGFTMVMTALSGHLVAHGWSVGAAGTVVGVMPVAALLARPVSGWLVDRVDQPLLLRVSVVVVALAVAGCAVPGPFWSLVLLRVVHGAAFSVTTTVSLALVSGLLPAQALGRGIGIFGAAQAAALAIGPAVGFGVAGALGSAAEFLLAAGLVLAGLLPAAAVRPPRAAQGDRRERAVRGFRIGDLVAREAVLLGVAALAIGALSGLELAFVAPWAAQLGVPAVGWYFALSAAAVLLARPVAGGLADRRGLLMVACPGAALAGVGVLLLGLARPATAVPLLACAAVLKALGAGLVQPALQSAIIRSVGGSRRGAASATYFLGVDVGQGLAPVSGGLLAQAAGFGVMFSAFSAAAGVVVGACVLHVRRGHARQVCSGVQPSSSAALAQETSASFPAKSLDRGTCG